jgi:YidC/Oxa1 family membrane protein insertase
MDRRTLIAVALSIAVLVIWTWLFTPPPAPPDTAPPAGAARPSPVSGAPSAPGTGSTGGAEAESGPRGGSADLSGLGGAAGGAARPDLPPGEKIAAPSEEVVSIDTPLWSIRLSNRGARVVSWRLTKYPDDAGKPLELVSAAGSKLDHLPLQFLLDDPASARRLKEALFRVTRRETGDGHPATEVVFAWSDGAGLMATKTLRIEHDSYVAEVEVAAAVEGRPVTPTLVWGAGFGAHDGLETGRFSDSAYAVLDLGGRVTRIPQTKVKPESAVADSGPIVWAGLEDRYFAAVLVPQEAGAPGPGAPAGGAATPAAGMPGGVPGRARIESLRLVEEGREKFFLSFALGVPAASHFHLFVGPKDYDLLKGLRLGLENLLDFGMFSVIALPLFRALKFIHRYTGNFGWAIVLLTFGIRLLFFPFMHKSQVKMRRMQDKMKRVQPKLKALRERYHRLERKEIEKGNPRARHQLRQKQNEEMMDLYREEGINPMASMSGCLPLLLQLPILYAFYAILTIAIELRRAPFLLWVHDLSQKDPYYVTPIVMGVTMLLQQAMTSSSIADPAQRRMMYVMPILFTYFFVNLPSGLVLYWLTSNLLGIAQQYLINREVEAESKPA